MLALEEADKDLLLDALVYPDEYEGEEIRFPDRIRALDGESRRGVSTGSCRREPRIAGSIGSRPESPDLQDPAS